MRLHRYGSVSMLVCSLQGFFPLFGGTSAAQVGVRVSFERFVLPNGLTLIVHENHDLPLAHVRMFYDVAEKDAGPGQAGHAHLFEHLAFSRTEQLDRSIWRFLEAIGARDYDANSRYDYTHYYATVPVAVLDTILWMEAQQARSRRKTSNAVAGRSFRKRSGFCDCRRYGFSRRPPTTRTRRAIRTQGSTLPRRM